MMASLSRRERRLVAVAMLCALLALLLYGVVLPIVDGFSDRAAMRDTLRETYARDERAVVQIASVRRAAEAQRRDAGRFRLDGASPTLAADRLKERIGAAITAAGGDLRSVEDIAAVPGAIRVRADARMVNPQLVAMLAAIERSDPLLVVENLSVTADQAFQTGRASPLDIRIEISGSYPATAPR